MHNIGRIFCSGKGLGTSGASGSSISPGSKKRHSEADGLRADMRRDFERVSKLKVLPTKWVNHEFLSLQGILEDFEQMTMHASMAPHLLLLRRHLQGRHVGVPVIIP